MMSKTVLIAAVGAISAISVGAGTFLAYRANQTPTPIITATAAPTLTAPKPTPATAPVSSGTSQSALPVISSRSTDRPATRNDAKSTETPGRATAPAPAQEPVTPPTTATAAPPVPTPVETPPATTTAAAATAAVEPPPPPVQEAPKPRLEEVTVTKDSVIGIRIDQTVSSETARVEDRVTAKVTRDVTVDGRTAIAAGTKLEGVVTVVERGGKFRERARLGIKFNMMILADGLRVPIQTEAILREGDSPSNEATSKIGAGAVAGAIIGGILGGKRGAVIGSTAGVGAGTAAVATGGRNDATIAGGAPLTVRLTSPLTVTIERQLLLASSR